MGGIFSNPRNITFELLESLDEKLKNTTCKINRLKSQQNTFRIIFLTSMPILLIAYIAFYVIEFKSESHYILVYGLPILLIPFIGFIIYKLICKYFINAIKENSEQYMSLRIQKDLALEQVKNEETYHVASEILQRFGNT